MLAVGFHDAGAHTTSIRAMKNLILLGDALRGVSLLAFQEDPYKLVPLGRELRGSSVATVDFLVADGKMLIVSMDMHGVMRTYEYDPLRKSLCPQFAQTSALTLRLQIPRRKLDNDCCSVLSTSWALSQRQASRSRGPPTATRSRVEYCIVSMRVLKTRCNVYVDAPTVGHACSESRWVDVNITSSQGSSLQASPAP